MHEQDEAYRLWALTFVHHATGHRAESDAALRELVERNAETLAYLIAEAFAHRGEIDTAFDWLERAYTQRDGGLVGAKTSRRLRSLHGDPRWDVFLKKVGFV